MDHILTIEAKDQFQAGVNLLETDLNGAIDVLGEFYGKLVEEEGDLGRGVAPIAFVYGDANLRLAVESNKEYLDAEVKKRADKERADAAAAAATAEGDDIGKVEAEVEEEGEGEVMPALSREEITELFEIAWECLDTARVIYERLASEESDHSKQQQIRSRLASVMLRLGDLKLEQGQFEDSIPEYEKCLAIRQDLEEPSSRNLAAAYHSLGMAYEFADTERPDTTHRIKAAWNMAKAQVVLRENRRRLIQGDAASALALTGKTDEEDAGSKKKKKATYSRTWIGSLTPEQLEMIDEAYMTASAPLVPPKSDTHPKEALEICELVEQLAGKVDDVTWILTEEGLAEERKKEDEVKRAQAAAPVEQIGFGSPTPLTATASNLQNATLTPEQASTSASVAPVVEPNILQPKKRSKIVPQSVTTQEQQPSAFSE